MVGWVLPSKKPRDHRAWVVLVSAACVRRLKIDPAAFLHDPHPSLCRRLPRTSLSIERSACCLAVHDLLRNLTNNGSRGRDDVAPPLQLLLPRLVEAAHHENNRVDEAELTVGQAELLGHGLAVAADHAQVL